MGGATWYVVKELGKPKILGMPEEVDPSKIVGTLEAFIDEAYGDKAKSVKASESVKVEWQNTPRGKRFVTPDGFQFEIDASADRATVTMNGRFEGKPKPVLQSLRMGDFTFPTIPNSIADRTRLGSDAHDDYKLLEAAHEKAQLDFMMSWKKPAQKSSERFRGKMFEGTVDFDYDEPAKKASFRLEVKKIGN